MPGGERETHRRGVWRLRAFLKHRNRQKLAAAYQKASAEERTSSRRLLASLAGETAVSAVMLNLNQ